MNWKLASLISLGPLALAWSQSCTHKYGDDCEVERSCIEDVGGPGGGGGVGGQGGSAGAGACEETCGGAAPVCEAESRECVECTTSDHCAAGVCDPDSHACEQCIESSDCTETAAPRCADNACTSCTESSDCAHFADAKLCDEDTGSCVACLTEDDCDGNVCSPEAKTCTDLPARALQACETCQHDAQCQEGQVCVETSYSNPAEGVVGSFCLWRRDATAVGAPNGSCGLNSQPYARTSTVTSVDGQDAIVCELATTTCPALLHHRTAVEGCDAPGDDAACGHPDFNDGRCRHNNPIDEEPRCSYPCLGNEDCQAGSTCPAAGDRYCSL